jgi:hypothetical protein
MGSGAARCRGDGGAVLVEAALLSPVLLLMLLAMFEYGALFRDVLGINDAVASGAKYAAIQGPDTSRVLDNAGVEVGSASADFTTMLNTRAGLAGMDPANIERIVIYKARKPASGTAMEQVPEACKTSGVSIDGVCNVYLLPTAFVRIQEGNLAYYSCITGSVTEPACGWDPSSRRDGPGFANIDYIGVYIKMRRPTLSGIIPVARTIEAASVQRLEPGQSE